MGQKGKKRGPYRKRDRLLALAGEVFASVSLSKMVDAEQGDACWVVQGIDQDGQRFRECRQSLVEAVSAVLGEERSKRCKGPCQRDKPLCEYSRCRRSQDGLCPRCRTCESIRKKEYRRRKGQVPDDES